MTLPREEVATGLLDELSDLETLVRSLDEAEWAKATRCEGWSVADVCAHVAGGMSDILAGRFDGIGSQERIDRQVGDRRGRHPSELADEVAGVRDRAQAMLSVFDDAAWEGPAPVDLVPTLGFGVEGLWYDTYVHNEDIRAALGREPRRGRGLRGAVSHLAGLLEQRGYEPATLALDGLEEFMVGGGGRRITGDPLEFVSVATGRSDPARLGLDERINVYR